MGQDQLFFIKTCSVKIKLTGRTPKSLRVPLSHFETLLESFQKVAEKSRMMVIYNPTPLTLQNNRCIPQTV